MDQSKQKVLFLAPEVLTGVLIFIFIAIVFSGVLYLASLTGDNQDKSNIIGEQTSPELLSLPSINPTPKPTLITPQPTKTPLPTKKTTPLPSLAPSPTPSLTPTPSPSPTPNSTPSPTPTLEPTPSPSPNPTPTPTQE